MNKPESPPPNTGNIRSAMTILPELRGGRTITDLSAAIHDAIAAVREHGKKAEVRLVLTLGPSSEQRLVDPAIIIQPRVEMKLPTETPDATLFFIDRDGNPTRQLDREDRRQPDIGFTTVTTPSTSTGG